MQILYSGELSRRKLQRLRAEVMSAISTSMPAVRSKFVKLPATVGQVIVTVDLAEGEIAPPNLFNQLTAVVDRHATPKREAKVRLKNCGKTPETTWHRWSNRKEHWH